MECSVREVVDLGYDRQLSLNAEIDERVLVIVRRGKALRASYIKSKPLGDYISQVGRVARQAVVAAGIPTDVESDCFRIRGAGDALTPLTVAAYLFLFRDDLLEFADLLIGLVPSHRFLARLEPRNEFMIVCPVVAHKRGVGQHDNTERENRARYRGQKRALCVAQRTTRFHRLPE